jgi:hypothetical protein
MSSVQARGKFKNIIDFSSRVNSDLLAVDDVQRLHGDIPKLG